MANQFNPYDQTQVPNVTAPSPEETLAGKGSASFVVEVLVDAADTPRDQVRRPKPYGNAKAFSAGEGDDKVIDQDDAPFNLNENPFRSTNV